MATPIPPKRTPQKVLFFKCLTIGKKVRGYCVDHLSYFKSFLSTPLLPNRSTTELFHCCAIGKVNEKALLFPPAL